MENNKHIKKRELIYLLVVVDFCAVFAPLMMLLCAFLYKYGFTNNKTLLYVIIAWEVFDVIGMLYFDFYAIKKYRNKSGKVEENNVVQ